MTATAAKGAYPFRDHRTVAAIDEQCQSWRAELSWLDAASRTRALDHAESLRLERLLRRVAA